MTLEKLLEPLLESEAFQSLLDGPAPRLARADATGHPYVLAALAEAAEAPVMVVAPGPREADHLVRGAAAFLGAERVALFPAWEALPSEGISPGPEVVARRAEAAHRLERSKGPFLMVTPVAAALQRIVPTLARPPRFVEAGDQVAPDALTESLVARGYRRADLVMHRGEFAVRGGIVDVFPGSASRPVRAEFFGDEVERIREFSPATQVTTGPAGRVEVFPVRELLPDEEVRERARAEVPRHKGRPRELLDRIAEGLVFEGMEQAAPLVYDEMPVLADLLPEGSWVSVTSVRRTLERARGIAAESAALAEATGLGRRDPMADPDEALEGRPRADLTEFTEGTDLGISGWEGLPGERLASRAAALAGEGYTVALSAVGRGSLERAREVLGRAGLSDLPSELAIESGVLEGFLFPEGRIAVVGEDDLFGRRRRAHEAPRVTGRPAAAFAEELSPGDFAVHRVHGVGKYVGMVRRAIGGSERDYLLLEYAAGDRLYVPAEQVDVVSRYVGGEQPRLHRLGTNDWPRAKARVRRAVRDMAGELVRLYSARMAAEGYAFGPDTTWQRELEDVFPHEETRDQLAAIVDVKRSMETPKPMDRLICGDVGYGKTEIAVRAAFKAAMDGKQVAVLVPTTLLAEQHFVTFGERFAPFPVRLEMLSRFLSKAEQQRVIEDLAEGKVDVVIGTHRLLSPDVRFKDLGLLVVDEEQRFGVAHKERLKRLRVNVDVLTMTATPIPRTLEMALSGVLGPGRRPLDRPVRGGPAGEDPRGPDGDRSRADGRGPAREDHAGVLERRDRRPGLHHDHRVRPRRPVGEHTRRGPCRPDGAVPALPTPGPGGPLRRAGLRVPVLPGPDPPLRRGPRAAGRDQPAHRARVGVPGGHAGSGDPRRRQPPRGRAVRAHRRCRVRHLRPPAGRVGGRAEGPAAARGAGDPDRAARPGVPARRLPRAGVAPPGPVPADRLGRDRRGARGDRGRGRGPLRADAGGGPHVGRGGPAADRLPPAGGGRGQHVPGAGAGPSGGRPRGSGPSRGRFVPPLHRDAQPVTGAARPGTGPSRRTGSSASSTSCSPTHGSLSRSRRAKRGGRNDRSWRASTSRS